MRKNRLRKSDLVILALRCSQLETSHTPLSGASEEASDDGEKKKLPCDDCPFRHEAGCVDLLMAELAQTLWRTLPACARK
jgi:hypothetical protein